VEFERTIAATGGTADGLAQTLAGEVGEAEGADPSESLTQGVSLGRYVIVGRLGEGGMGVVFAAYDPELDRRVALKLLSRAAAGDEARLRMLREAQAMARLQHAHVVTVHDVGTTPEGRVWVAMEHVRGVTLRQWLTRPRPWSQVLEVMRAVGRGLNAAHEAGLVHRDIKPENVMIGDDGRVLVMDFGLARAGEAPAEPVTLELSGPSLLGSALTDDGALVGTPRYMAPEQLLRAAVDARADQFSWCVVCWEALYGERPYTGETLEELRRAMLGGRRRTPARRGVPGGVHRALERGLSASPARRFPSMAALLAALDAALRRRRWRFVAYGALVLSLGAGAASAVGHARAAALADTCAAAGAEIEAVWGEPTRRRVAEAFAATGLPGAAEALARARPWLDAYAQAWAKARTELCAAAGGTAATPGSTAALECLEDRRASLDALVGEVYMHADKDVVMRAVDAASRLPPVAQCVDADWLVRAPRRPADPTARARVAALRVKLERSLMLKLAGKYEAATEIAAEVQREAEALAWPPVIAGVQLQVASIQIMRAEFAPAEKTLVAVVMQATGEGDDRLAAQAASNLAYVVGDGLGRPDEGVRWGHLALAMLRRIGEDDGLEAADTLAALGIVEEGRGNFEEGHRLKERALTIRERHLGPEHPAVGTAYNLLGINHLARGDMSAAQRAHERGLAIRIAALGSDHLEVASSHLNLGNVYLTRNEYARAAGLYTEARRIFAASLGPGHPSTTGALANLALCQTALGELDAALANLRQTLADRERALGPEHPLVAYSRAGIGDVLVKMKDLAGAEAEYRQVLANFERALGPEHQNVALALYKLADVRRMRGDTAEALPLLERAVTIARTREVPPVVRVAMEFKLGQALWDSGTERERARALLLATLPELLDGGVDGGELDMDEVRGWLAEHDAELRAVSLKPSG
jgi:tetratricopeptide (TPR) repeat protein